MPKRESYSGYDDFYFPKSTPIKTKDGIKAKTKRGAFGESWWGKRWLAVLNNFGIGSRLQRGRSYARNGQVLDLDISPGNVTARVQGSRPTPYKVSIQLPQLKDNEWAKVIEAMGAQAVFSAKLLSGEMPNEIEEIFNTVKTPLFPTTQAQLITDCSCPDYSNPCKHIAAVYYLISEQFDADPFLIFTLRGRTRDQLITALRAQRAAVAAEVEPTEALPEIVATPLDANLSTFWIGGDLLVFQPVIAPAAVNLAILKRLGNSPLDTTKDLSTIYQVISSYALKLAHNED